MSLGDSEPSGHIKPFLYSHLEAVSTVTRSVGSTSESLIVDPF